MKAEFSVMKNGDIRMTISPETQPEECLLWLVSGRNPPVIEHRDNGAMVMKFTESHSEKMSLIGA